MTAVRRTTSFKEKIYFTFECRDTLKSFSMFLFVKTISKLNLKHNDKFEIEIYNLPVLVHVLYTTLNRVISRGEET